MDFVRPSSSVLNFFLNRSRDLSASNAPVLSIFTRALQQTCAHAEFCSCKVVLMQPTSRAQISSARQCPRKAFATSGECHQHTGNGSNLAISFVTVMNVHGAAVQDRACAMRGRKGRSATTEDHACTTTPSLRGDSDLKEGKGRRRMQKPPADNMLGPAMSRRRASSTTFEIQR